MAESSVSAFISYSRTDSIFVDRLEVNLRAYGFDIWVDRRHLEGGADWARVIEQQITRCEALVVALSPDAITSTWVRRETMFALNAGKPIIPIVARPVEQVPLEIVNLQYIDLGTDYTSGLQDLRVALLRVRALPPAPRPTQAPQPLLTLPDVSDPLKGLVQISPAPPAPNPDLNALFMQAQSALAHNELDLADVLLGQIVEREATFGNGAATQLRQSVRRQLEPLQIGRLRKMADDAHACGAWGQEIGALRALIERLPHDEDAADRLPLAEDCQKYAWLYENARSFALSGDANGAQVALAQVWENAPYFGDPSHIASNGQKPPLMRRQFATLVLEAVGGNKPWAPASIVVATLPFSIGESSDLEAIERSAHPGPVPLGYASKHSYDYGFSNVWIIYDGYGRFGIKDTRGLSYAIGTALKQMLHSKPSTGEGHVADIRVNGKLLRRGSVQRLRDYDKIIISSKGRMSSMTFVFRLPLEQRSKVS